MRLFGRVFTGHLLTILVTCSVLALAAGLVSPGFYEKQLNSVRLLVTPEFAWLRVSLEEGHRQTMLLSLIVAVPLAVLLAALTAWFETRRITAAVEELAEGSRDIAEGQYTKRLAARGADELTAIAQHFNSMAQALEEAEGSRVRMIGTVAHELRTPLSALQGYSEALLDRFLPTDEAAQGIAREVSLLRRMTHDLLTVARVEGGEITLRPTPHAPRALLEEAYERFLYEFEAKGVGLRLEVPDPLPTMHADSERVSQVLGNLLLNALHHTPPGGCVSLKAEAGAGMVRFSVTDTGPGIPPEHQPHLFERFYRVDGARNRSDGGMGVGLTVVRGLVEAMGGRVWLESEPGVGSTFFFALPSTG